LSSKTSSISALRSAFRVWFWEACMRVFPRIALILAVVVLSASPLLSQPIPAGCPLTLVGTNPPPASSAFYQSPHGVFRYGNQVFVLRGQTLTTYNVTDLGDLQVIREDFNDSLAARESNGGVVFSSGFLGVSREAGFELFDLRDVRAVGWRLGRCSGRPRW